MNSTARHFKGLVRMQPAQRGMALFVTLVLVTTMLIIISTVTYQYAVDERQASRALIADQSLLLALSGESYAKKLLEDDRNQTDTLIEDWAQTIPPLPVDGGVLTGCIRDLSGRFNLNALGNYNQSTFARDLLETEQANLLRVYLQLLKLRQINASEERAAVIVDWIDADSNLVMSLSAEDDDYSVQTPSRLAANQMLLDPSMLTAIMGYSAIDLWRIQDAVSTIDQSAKININTALPVLLEAILTAAQIDPIYVEDIIKKRPFSSIDGFYREVASLSFYSIENLKIKIPNSLFTLNSSYYELHARVTLLDTEIALTSILHKTDQGVSVLSRSMESVPIVELQDGVLNPLISPCIPLT